MKFPNQVLLFITCAGMLSFIVIRHDKTDAEYLALGKQFPSVCKVGEHGGDGTMIASQWVITAAHVADGMFKREGANLKIFFAHQKAGFEVEQIFIHPDFKPFGNHDIALIKLKSPVTKVTPAALYRNSNEKGKQIIIVGHGDFKTGLETTWKMDGKKRGATNQIDDANDYHILFDFDKPGAKDITSLEGTAGRGDSGGPAIIQIDKKNFVAGISSAGSPGENGPGTYGALEHYTRVSKYTDWIDNVMAGKIVANKSTPTLNADEPFVQEGLGLLLLQGKGRIDIEGKVDDEVPVEFRDIRFGPPPSFIVSLNGKQYEDLNQFTSDFKGIKAGTKYTIEFSIRGDLKKFETVR